MSGIVPCCFPGCRAHILVTDLGLHMRHHAEVERSRQGAQVGSTEREMSIAQASDAKIRREIERGARTIRTAKGNLSGRYGSRVETGDHHYQVDQCNYCKARRFRRDGDSWVGETVDGDCLGHKWLRIYDSQPVKVPQLVPSLADSHVQREVLNHV